MEVLARILSSLGEVRRSRRASIILFPFFATESCLDAACNSGSWDGSHTRAFRFVVLRCLSLAALFAGAALATLCAIIGSAATGSRRARNVATAVCLASAVLILRASLENGGLTLTRRTREMAALIAASLTAISIAIYDAALHGPLCASSVDVPRNRVDCELAVLFGVESIFGLAWVRWRVSTVAQRATILGTAEK